MTLMMRFLFLAGLLVSVSCISTHTNCPQCAGKRHSTVKGHKGQSHSSAICSHCVKKRSASASASICSHCAKKRSAAHKQGEHSSHSASGSACSHCAKKHSHAALEGSSSKQTDSASSVDSASDKSSVKPAGHSHLSSSAPVTQEKKGSALHRIVGDLSFAPINGPAFQLSALKKPKAIVIIMREKDCPISEKYGPRLARLEEKYAKQGIQFIYNYVGQVRSEDSAKQDLNTQKFKGPYAIDKTQKVVHALSAKTTGDVFILTPDRKVVYRGPVDDQYHLLKSAIKPKNHYVADILKAIVKGKAFIPKELPAPGCLISPPIGQTTNS